LTDGPDARFQSFADRKARQSAAALIQRLSTVRDHHAGADWFAIGNAWSRDHYGGDFSLFRPRQEQTAVSLVFVQSRDGNTGAPNPSALGGGATDMHLIYEGLSRVAADAVLTGAGTLHRDAFFSVWHPELIALRLSLGLARHPAQIVVSQRGRFSLETLLFNVPEVPVFLIGGEECLARHGQTLVHRPWIHTLPLVDGDLRRSLDRLREEAGVRRLSAIGGPSTATSLVDEGLVQDLYLTTTARTGGDPGTPWYCGTRRPTLAPLALKAWREDGLAVTFAHLSISRAAGLPG
jgi:riboflavin biosynthesis pyrimidine reductase